MRALILIAVQWFLINCFNGFEVRSDSSWHSEEEVLKEQIDENLEQFDIKPIERHERDDESQTEPDDEYMMFDPNSPPPVVWNSKTEPTVKPQTSPTTSKKSSPTSTKTSPTTSKKSSPTSTKTSPSEPETKRSEVDNWRNPTQNSKNHSAIHSTAQHSKLENNILLIFILFILMSNILEINE